MKVKIGDIYQGVELGLHLAPLTEEMIRLTRQTLQPDTVSVWLTCNTGIPSSTSENSA